MNLKLVAHNLGIIALLMACSMFGSLIWALPCFGGVWEYEKNGVFALLFTILLSAANGLMFLKIGGKPKKTHVFRREAVAIVGLGWILASILSSFPYVLSGVPRTVLEDGTRVELTHIDAMYESVSGLTTTGGSVFGELEDPAVMPRTILFWRSMTHFIGGMGIMVLLVALMDTGMAGRALLQSEATGPKQPFDSRVKLVATRTVTIYLGLNAALTLIFMYCGISCFDSLCHSFGTIATGGLGTKNTSFRYFQTVPGVDFVTAEWAMAIFMLIAGMNFLSLYFCALGKWRPLFKSRETQGYVLIVLAATGIIASQQFLEGAEVFGGGAKIIRDSFYQVTSCITTTGYASCNYTNWSIAAQMVFLLLMFVTACSGSTCGGPKVVRYILLSKILHLELEKAYRPTIVRSLTYNGEHLRGNALANGILLYFSMMFLALPGIWICLIFFEPDTAWLGCPSVTASKAQDLFGLTISHFSNVGYGIGEYAFNHSFGELTQASKFIFICTMLIGRLDFLGIFLLFFPGFWKR